MRLPPRRIAGPSGRRHEVRIPAPAASGRRGNRTPPGRRRALCCPPRRPARGGDRRTSPRARRRRRLPRASQPSSARRPEGALMLVAYAVLPLPCSFVEELFASDLAVFDGVEADFFLGLADAGGLGGDVEGVVDGELAGVGGGGVGEAEERAADFFAVDRKGGGPAFGLLDDLFLADGLGAAGLGGDD